MSFLRKMQKPAKEKTTSAETQAHQAINESTVRTFKKKYYELLREKSKEELDKSQSVPKYSRKTGRPFLLGELDEMVRKYLLTLSKRGGVINTTVANATAKALMSKYPHVVG